MTEPKIIKYPNGLTLVYLKRTKQKSVYLNFKFSGGLYNDPPDKLGLSHFLEHTIALSDNKYSNDEKMEYLRKIFYRSFSTNVDRVIFRAYVHRDLFEDTFKTYCEYLSSNDINKEEFENERKVIHQEILRRKLDNDLKLSKMENKYVFNLPYTETRPAGEIETVNNITLDDVKKHREEILSINNCTIFVVGNVSLLKVKSCIQKYAISTFRTSKTKNYMEINDYCQHIQEPIMIVEQSPNGDKSLVSIEHYYDFKDVITTEKDYISKLINGNMQNAARSYFRDKFGLTYRAEIEFGSYILDHKNVKATRCYVDISVECDKNNIAKVLEVLPEFYDYLKKYSFDEEKAKDIKLTIERDEQMKKEGSTYDVGEDYAEVYYDRKKFLTSRQERKDEKKNKKVNYKEINNYMATLLSQKPFIFIVSNTDDTLPQYESLCKEIQDNLEWCKSLK